jgi:hypothetical protein
MFFFLLHLEIDNESWLRTKFYKKRDVSFSTFLWSNIPAASGIYICQVIDIPKLILLIRVSLVEGCSYQWSYKTKGFLVLKFKQLVDLKSRCAIDGYFLYVVVRPSFITCHRIFNTSGVTSGEQEFLILPNHDMWVLCSLMATQHFSAILWREHVNCQWDDDEIHFVLDQHA